MPTLCELLTETELTHNAPAHLLVHDFNHLLGQLHQGVVKAIDACIHCSQAGVRVLDYPQRPLPLQLVNCEESREGGRDCLPFQTQTLMLTRMRDTFSWCTTGLTYVLTNWGILASHILRNFAKARGVCPDTGSGCSRGKPVDEQPTTTVT